MVNTSVFVGSVYSLRKWLGIQLNTAPYLSDVRSLPHYHGKRPCQLCLISLTWQDPTQRKDLVQCLTCIRAGARECTRCTFFFLWFISVVNTSVFVGSVYSLRKWLGIQLNTAPYLSDVRSLPHYHGKRPCQLCLISLTWQDPTQRKDLVQCLTCICI